MKNLNKIYHLFDKKVIFISKILNFDSFYINKIRLNCSRKKIILKNFKNKFILKFFSKINLNIKRNFSGNNYAFFSNSLKKLTYITNKYFNKNFYFKVLIYKGKLYDYKTKDVLFLNIKKIFAKIIILFKKILLFFINLLFYYNENKKNF
ncbi:hypothetical protein [Candidatus Vidania fulgoroideorum]